MIRTLENALFLVGQDLRLAWMVIQIHAELRARFPEDNVLDRIDKLVKVLTLRNAEARLALTLKVGSLHEEPVAEKEQA